MRYSIGKNPHKFLLSMNTNKHGRTFFRIGRLYKGYVGLMLTIHNVFSMDVWILNWEK